MNAFLRWLVNVLAALSLLLCLAIGVCWAASYADSLPALRPYYVSFCIVHLRSSSNQMDYQALLYHGIFDFKWIDARRGVITSTDHMNVHANQFGFGMVRAPVGIAPGFAKPWGREGAVDFPFWFALLVVVAAASPVWIACWRRPGRYGPGLCARCGYDLRATPDRCPECGTIPTKGK
jgi:hypothetical protein